MVRKEQSDNSEINNDAKSIKLPIVSEDISVEKIEQVHEKKSKRGQTTKRKENNIRGCFPSPLQK